MSNYQQSYQTPEGTGRLWKNDKEGNERRPDLNGEAMYKGQLIEIAGWWTTTKKDGSPCKPHLNITVKDKQQQQRKSQPTHVNKIVDKVVNDLDDFDSLPF